MRDRNRGLYGKFNVIRNDGQSEPGQKHDGCEYFVLDVTHDPFAGVALAAYEKACEIEYPLLARDLEILRLARHLIAPTGEDRRQE
jgi:hypothetical protein